VCCVSCVQVSPNISVVLQMVRVVHNFDFVLVIN
jgi:hypothetical protein